MPSIANFLDKVSGSRPLGHGPWSEADSGWVDQKPYVSHWSSGLFEGYDDSMWVFFGLPEDIQVDWLKSNVDAIQNQQWFIQMSRALGEALDGQTEKVKKDIRRDFHIQITQDTVPMVTPYKDALPAHADYLRRMGEHASKPAWSGYIGFKILPTTIFHEAFGFRAQMNRYLEMFSASEAMQLTYLRQDLEEINRIAGMHGLRTLDFTEDIKDFNRLTAWDGIADEQYMLPLQLQNRRAQEPVHGKSMIVPKWGEIVFHALTPREGVDLGDPRSAGDRWATPIFHPESGVVIVNIRGQIRAPSVSENLLGLKKVSKANAPTDDENNTVDQLTLIQMARDAVVNNKLPMLDNLEIIVGTMVPERQVAEPYLVREIRNYGLQLQPLVDRQPQALNSTYPTYPHHVMRIPRGNRRRPELTNVMLPGVLAFSGIFRANKPCATNGLCIGVGDSGNQYIEIFVEPDGAYKYNGVPGWLVTGRPGAGKTQFMLQMMHQSVYMGMNVFYFNPKKTGTLQASFDHVGGTTLSMSRRYLADNPGMLDPVFFFTEREEVARILGDSLFIAGGLYDDTGSAANQRRTKVLAEIRDQALDPRNRTSGDILLGNKAVGTMGISDRPLVSFITDKIKTSPFWRAFISTDANAASSIQERINNSHALLLEWDNSMSLPDVGTERYTDDQTDTILSISVSFAYAAAKIGSSGGMIIVDESWVLKNSKEALSILQKGGREWRQGNIVLMLGSQEIMDWAGGASGGSSIDLTSYFGRYTFLALPGDSKAEHEKFFEMTGLPKTDAYLRYMVNAGVDARKGRSGNRIPRGYHMDRIHDWEGGIITGPWPELELNLGRTDQAGEAARQAGRLDTDDNAMPSGTVMDFLADRDELLSTGVDV